MIHDVGFALLHDTVFVGGKNMSDKLDTKALPGLILSYDNEVKELYITWNDETMNVPEPNVRGYVLKKNLKPKVSNFHHAQAMGTSQTAQVETPMSHVHAGAGHGKTGVGGKIK